MYFPKRWKERECITHIVAPAQNKHAKALTTALSVCVMFPAVWE